MGHTLRVLGAFAGVVARGGRGVMLQALGERPEKPLQLYDFENCPFCRKVREALTELDLEVLVYPCPVGGTRFRPRAIELSGKSQFPYLVDPNTGQSLLESDDINRYLFQRYGKRAPGPLMTGPLATVLSGFASAGGLGRGTRARPSRQPEQPLELYSFEGSPYARMARETLCELELPYLLHNVGKVKHRDYVPAEIKHRAGMSVNGSTRQAFVQRSGKMMVPYLIDPNTGWEGFQSEAICAYLNDTYAT